MIEHHRRTPRCREVVRAQLVLYIGALFEVKARLCFDNRREVPVT